MTPAANTVTTAGRLAESALADDLSFLIARANALSLAAGNAALAEYRLKARSYSVLALAAGDARPSQRELADFLRLDPSQVVPLIDELQTRGLVSREPDPEDRRANVLVATKLGRELYEKARRAALSAEQQLHSTLTSDQREVLGHLLREIALNSPA